MSREKQIEEMLNVVRDNTESCKTCTWYNEGLCLDDCELEEDNQKICTDLYNASYRKQEWISVDERLPDIDPSGKGRYGGTRSVRVLCACKQKGGKTFVKEGYYEPCGNGRVYWRIPGSIDTVTHWMPLPEPPKGE